VCDICEVRKALLTICGKDALEMVVKFHVLKLYKKAQKNIKEAHGLYEPDEEEEESDSEVEDKIDLKELPVCSNLFKYDKETDIEAVHHKRSVIALCKEIRYNYYAFETNNYNLREYVKGLDIFTKYQIVLHLIRDISGKLPAARVANVVQHLI
jgi:hypothetical protein